MTDIENHMVIGNEETDRDIMMDRIKDREDYERVKEAAEHLLAGGRVPFYSSSYLSRAIPVRHFDIDDVITRAWDDDEFPDCAKEILELYPDSKLAKLIKHMAVVVAADALDIEI